jgi:hypothetical protein
MGKEAKNPKELRKGRPVVFNLPPVKTAADVIEAVGELARAMAAGELTVRGS